MNTERRIKRYLKHIGWLQTIKRESNIPILLMLEPLDDTATVCAARGDKFSVSIPFLWAVRRVNRVETWARTHAGIPLKKILTIRTTATPTPWFCSGGLLPNTKEWLTKIKERVRTKHDIRYHEINCVGDLMSLLRQSRHGGMPTQEYVVQNTLFHLYRESVKI